MARSRASRAVYVISVAAELAGVHPQTLRTYERRGLIEPTRTVGGTRRYSERDIDRVRLVQQLTQEEGVNLAGVTRILELQDRLEETEARLSEALAQTEQVKAEARQALREAHRRQSGEVVLYRAPEIERHRTANRRRPRPR